MDWKEKYADKIVTAEEAMLCIHDGDLIMPADFGSEPVHLVDAMTKRAMELNGIRVSHGGNVGPEPHLDPEVKDKIHFNCLCAVPKSRQAILEKRADFTPCYFHLWPKLIREVLKPDICLIQITEPDENGMASLGISSDFTTHLPQYAKITIAQVNHNMPYIANNLIHVDQIDYLVEYDEPIVELRDSVPGEMEKRIGANVVDLIHDGDCLQLGRGKLPDYVMTMLQDKKDLGIHSEMLSDGVMKLVKQGVITNKYKKIHPGKIVASMLCGSAELYRWADHNDDLLLLPVEEVNDPFVISQNDNVVSLNSAIEVDLLGQVVCDMIGTTQFTGVGGFTDFVRGASRSKGGRTIVAFSSTASHDTISRIVKYVTPGAAVGATRYDVDYIVTEYGVAQLWGKTNAERVEALIAIAHPKFRDELREYAESVNLL